MGWECGGLGVGVQGVFEVSWCVFGENLALISRQHLRRPGCKRLLRFSTFGLGSGVEGVINAAAILNHESCHRSPLHSYLGAVSSRNRLVGWAVLPIVSLS